MLVSITIFIPTATVGSWLTERGRFALERPGYDRVVASLRASPAGAERFVSDGGLHYVVDPGPPMRLAFPWPGGLIDNWCGVVHDPSGRVLEVSALSPPSDRWRDSAITKLFGGDMLSCRPLDGAYSLCCFT